MCHCSEHILLPPGSERVRSKHPLSHSSPDTTLRTIHRHMYHASHYRHRVGQDFSVSVRPPSPACHQDGLSQVELGTVGILRHRHTCGFPCPMFSMRTASRIVEQKRESTMLRASSYDSDRQVSGRCVTSSRFHGLMDSHKRRFGCHNGHPLRTVAHVGPPKSTGQSTGKNSYLRCHRIWILVSRKELIVSLFRQTDL